MPSNSDLPMTIERRIRPAVLLTVDESSATLAAPVTLVLARRHAAALPFFASAAVPPDLEPQERGRRIRTAFEMVTDLRYRQEAVLAGYEVEDALHVFLAFMLASAEDLRLEALLETLHRTATDFFHQTPLTVHLLLFLPDLAEQDERERGYGLAYHQLAQIDELGTAARALAFRAHSSIDYRWLIDCRTRAGAHAGGISAVSEPMAEMISLLLANTTGDPYLAGAETVQHLRSIRDGRATAYSSSGTAILFHQPEMVLRYLCTQVAVECLTSYYMGSENSDRSEEELEAGAAEWAGIVEQNRVFLSIVPTERECRKACDQLAAALQRQIVRWLAELGTPDAQQTLKLLAIGSETVAGSVGFYRSVHLAALRDFLRIDHWQARVDHLGEEETGLRSALAQMAEQPETNASEEEGSGADAAARAELEEQLNVILTESAEARQELERREALLDLSLSPEELEQALAEIEDPEPTPEAASAGADTPPPHEAPAEPVRRVGWLGRLRARLFSTPADSDQTVSSSVPPPVEESVAATPGFSSADRRAQLVEERRWLHRYEELLREARTALAIHLTDVESALEYFEHQGKVLKRQLTDSTPFRIPALAPRDLEGYLTRLGPSLTGALEERYGKERLAACYKLDPVEIPLWKTRWLTRLQGFDEAVTAAGETAAGGLRNETLAELLAGAGTVPLDRPLVHWVRALLECSEPLLRPEVPEEDEGSPTLRRWLLADPHLQALLQADPGCRTVMSAQEGLATVDSPDPRFLTLASALHGFPMQSLRKLIALRREQRSQGGPLPEHEPVSPEASLSGAVGRTYELVVLAAALGCLPAKNGGYLVNEDLIPGDLRDVAEALAFTPALRPAEKKLREDVDELLNAGDAPGILRLAREESTDGIAREILLGAIAEIENQRRFEWDSGREESTDA